ncbi:DUF1330 domain-containing protein [Promicromonospora sukumoe]|uniref:DUF1330 domain-containing protein n=1 Tax=Promicromonospora sukumoe TaxID=88382 RepID=UPI00364D33E0
MSAYVVFFKESTHDQSEVDAYLENVGKSFEGHDAKILAAYGEQLVLEGPAPEGVVVIEFPTAAAARAWYDSPAYRAAAERRFNGAIFRVVLVEGA